MLHFSPAKSHALRDAIFCSRTNTIYYKSRARKQFSIGGVIPVDQRAGPHYRSQNVVEFICISPIREVIYSGVSGGGGSMF